MMPRRRKEEKSRNLRDSVEVTIFYPSKTVECLTIFGSRLNLVLSIVISNTCIFYAANDRRCLGIVDHSLARCHRQGGRPAMLACESHTILFYQYFVYPPCASITA